MNENLRSRLPAILRVSPDVIRPELPLDDSNWDSMTMISVIALIDEIFDTTIPVERLATCRNVANLIAAIDSAVAKKSGSAVDR